MQKCIRLKIIKPCNGESWDELGKILRDTMYASFKSANYVMRECYLHAMAKLNDEPTKKRYCYPRLTEIFPLVATHILNAMEKMAAKKWNQHSKKVLLSEISLPTFKKGLPFELHHENYKVLNDNGIYYIDAQLCSNKAERTRYQFIVAANDHSTRCILERIVNKEYKKGAGQISKDRKNNWYFSIPYQFEVEVTHYDIDKENIMGVDLGIVKAAYWAFNHSYKRGWISGDEITEFRKRVRARRIAIQEQGKYCGDGRIGHGTARRLLPVDVLSEKESNFRNTCNFRYAKKIVDEALRMRCGIIQIENLANISDSSKLSKFLKNWAYYDLQTKIINKAAEFGIEVRKVNPQYTSQRCSECGYIDQENRIDQANFICTSCGYGKLYHCLNCNSKQKEAEICFKCNSDTKKITVNADYNAARNLSITGIEKIILESLPDIKGSLKIKNAKGKRTR